MMRLTPPIEEAAMEGTDSTFTTEEQNDTGWNRKHHSRATADIATGLGSNDINSPLIS